MALYLGTSWMFFRFPPANIIIIRMVYTPQFQVSLAGGVGRVTAGIAPTENWTREIGRMIDLSHWTKSVALPTKTFVGLFGQYGSNQKTSAESIWTTRRTQWFRRRLIGIWSWFTSILSIDSRYLLWRRDNTHFFASRTRSQWNWTSHLHTNSEELQDRQWCGKFLSISACILVKYDRGL